MRSRIFALIFLVFLLVLTACEGAQTPVSPPVQEGEDAPQEGVLTPAEPTLKERMLDAFAAHSERALTDTEADFLLLQCGESACEALLDGLEKGLSVQEALWEHCALTDKTLTLLCGPEAENVHAYSIRKKDVTLAFTGDVCLADDWYNMKFYRARGYTVEDAFGPKLREHMTGADVLLINHEFCFSERGTPMRGKTYTFRADPKNVEILQKIGVDIACLANNHVYDYGPEAFTDTLTTLTAAGIPFAGGGENAEQAEQVQYFITGGRTVAFACATRAEKTVLTPEATDTHSGVLRTYDPTRFCEILREAARHADEVIAYVHWGAENETYLEPVIVEQARLFIDAGATAVVGSHAHRLQALDFYKGAPIFYNLGNFYFNLETEDTALATLTITEDGSLRARMIPCVQSLARVKSVEGTAAGERILNTLRALSPTVQIDEDGYFIPRA